MECAVRRIQKIIHVRNTTVRIDMIPANASAASSLSEFEVSCSTPTKPRLTTMAAATPIQIDRRCSVRPVFTR